MGEKSRWHLHNNAASMDEVCRADGSIVAGCVYGDEEETELLVGAPEVKAQLEEAKALLQRLLTTCAGQIHHYRAIEALNMASEFLARTEVKG